MTGSQWIRADVENNFGPKKFQKMYHPISLDLNLRQYIAIYYRAFRTILVYSRMTIVHHLGQLYKRKQTKNGQNAKFSDFRA